MLPSTVRSTLRLTLLRVGAMNSPRYRPAGLLLSWRGQRVMFDGGDAASSRQWATGMSTALT
jgi:hypothetical protein